MQNDPLVSVTNIQVLGAKTRNRDFLKCVGELLGFAKPNEDSEKEENTMYADFACRCVDNNDFVSLQELLKSVDIDAADYNGYTPIHRACETGNIGMMKYLLSKGASFNLGDSLGNTPMTLAIKNKHTNIVKVLRLLGGCVYMESVRIGMELCKAVQARDYTMLQAWYFAGTDMDQGDYNGRTAMHTAVRNRDVGTVAKLLEYGATPLVPMCCSETFGWVPKKKEQDAWGWTAINEAKKHHLTDILLLYHPLYTEKFTTKRIYHLYKASVADGLE